ncbi:CLUMA_CG018197, isoform A [Clunio marinus]|uniref:CLUMA_CG018197, isoform A n=1 Tax=Clunio marinus TaxID=568069 RepID=A0A1J1J380_9DIPT|nr:CLUMA_CG018197, isoform A [Clunio marinus]
MSTAILHAGSFIHDFNDIVLKNQNSSVKLNNVAINSSNYKEQIQRNNKDEMHFMKQRNDAYMTKFIAAQKRMPSEVNQHQHHNTLARTVSTPMPIPDANQAVTNLFSSLNDILNAGTTTGHRKLERTQSEPIPQTNTSRYKTELCRPFEEAGECKYGDKCQFAHGVHELRNLQRHPKYKTELCRTFHSVGFCPYGARCHFVHSSQEALTHNRQVAAYHARLQQQQQSRMKTMSISTGSDRETSSVGSISPTMTHAQNQGGSFFVDQSSPTNLFSYTFSPSNSPILDMAPISPPPPPAQFVKPQPFIDHHHQQQQQQQKHAKVMKQMSIPEERLPVFNQISSVVDSMNTLTI